MNMHNTSTGGASARLAAPETAAKLIANGYRLVPCMGKRVLEKGWTKREFCELDFTATHNVGIKTGQGVALVDIDVTDPEVSAAIQVEWNRRHPGTMQRTGKAPKTAFLVASDVGRKIEAKLSDPAQKVEVLANGQQFIAYGIHPDTKEPYHWHGLDPLDTFLGTKDALPVVTEAELKDFMQWVKDNHGPKEAQPKLSEQAASAAGFKFDTSTSCGQTEATDAETIEVLRTLLSEAPNTLGREDWVKLAVSLRVTYGDILRDAFASFSLGYIGGPPCSSQDAAHVWQSSGAAHTVSGIGPALALLKDAVGPDRFRQVYRDTFDKTRDHDGESSSEHINRMFDGAQDPKAAEIKPTAFVLRPPKQIPPRQWLYGKHLIRGFLSLTVAPGGLGKSSMVQVDALAMATGRDLIGAKPPHPLRVWVWNGEDPEDENRRRITAICMHYGLTAEDIGDRLHVDSGRVLPIKLATMDKNGPKIARPVSDQLKRAIIANKIDVLIIDPFVTTHEVNENDNMPMNAVAAEWRRIADETGCAIDLVHHVSKAASGGAADDIGIYGARGAGALIDAVRAARYLVRMTDHEACRFGIDGVDQRVTFRVCTDGKANLAPPEMATWRRMVSVSLGNGSGYWPEGDRVGVCTAWAPPDPMEGISVRDLQKVQQAIEASADAPRHNEQSGQWVGYVIADALKMDVGPGIKKQERASLQNAARAKIRTMIGAWIESGALATDTIKDARTGREAKIITVGDPVTEADIHGEVFD